MTQSKLTEDVAHCKNTEQNFNRNHNSTITDRNSCQQKTTVNTISFDRLLKLWFNKNTIKHVTDKYKIIYFQLQIRNDYLIV